MRFRLALHSEVGLTLMLDKHASFYKKQKK